MPDKLPDPKDATDAIKHALEFMHEAHNKLNNAAFMLRLYVELEQEYAVARGLRDLVIPVENFIGRERPGVYRA